MNRQVLIYGVDTGDFYSGNERRLHERMMKLRAERRELTENVGNKTAKIERLKKRLLEKLANKRGTYRVLDPKIVEKPKKVISVFESFLTRTIHAPTMENMNSEVCRDFIVVQVYYFDILYDLMHMGFEFLGERYVYYTSSAGQIRQKKAVFIRESVFRAHEKTLMCGLTVERINELGGCNSNKFLAYLALTNSATDVWNGFDINRCIVIDDFETHVIGDYDYISEQTYEVTRRHGAVSVPHTDGCGMILPFAFGAVQKNKMIRAPWIKGLLGVFDFMKFIEVNFGTWKVKDIWGDMHDLKLENIQVIFTKSQMKMWKYYRNWDEYKTMFRRYQCEAGYCNEEEEKKHTAKINYQMLQTLTDVTDFEVLRLAERSNRRLRNMCESVDGMLNVLGVTPDDTHRTAFQKAIAIYPDLINDPYAKKKLREAKNSLIRRYRAGKLEVYGKYTFILPDLYAACEHWFCGKSDPVGLLKNGEVYCRVYPAAKKLDCLRSPHLYREHCIRENVAAERDIEWFKTQALYTSCHDLISKVLMFDVDGDQSLVVADEAVIEIAQRNVKGIAPLYYDMRKAAAVELNSDSLYDGLIKAFTSGKIGMYSNAITKIWNSSYFFGGDDAGGLKAIKLLVAESNWSIDSAKTLYMPERPEGAKELISFYTSGKLPYFFRFAKDKESDKTNEANRSTMNRICAAITNVRVNTRKAGLNKPDWRLMVKKPTEDDFTVSGRILIGIYRKYTRRFLEYATQTECEVTVKPAQSADSALVEEIKYMHVGTMMRREMLREEPDEVKVADILTRYLYTEEGENVNKDLLWFCYGGYILLNLQRNYKKITRILKDEGIKRKFSKQCRECGQWYLTGLRRTDGICPDCAPKSKQRIG